MEPGYRSSNIGCEPRNSYRRRARVRIAKYNDRLGDVASSQKIAVLASAVCTTALSYF